MSDSNKRKIEILANEKFDGNVALAIKHIIENRQIYNCDEYYLEFTDFEKRIVNNILYDMALTEFGKKAVKSNPMYYYQEVKKFVFPAIHQQDCTLTKEKVWNRVLMYKTNTIDYIMKFGIFLTIFTYIFAVPISFLFENFLILLYPLPILIGLFIIFYIIKLWNKKAIEKEKEKGFNIIKATCTSVKRNPEYGETDISSNEVYFNGYIRYTDYSLNPDIQLGTPCYLASVDGEIKAVFLASEWRLDSELSNMLK